MKKFNAVGCSIFAGGFTVGMAKHFNILAHFEEGEFGTETFKLNFPKVPVYIGVRNWPYIDDVHVVYGNPPCAAWSPVGASLFAGKDNWRTDLRVEFTRNLFTTMIYLRPKIWVWESVPRAFSNGKDFVNDLTKKALKMGYAVTYFLTNAEYYGLPQRRVRFHMICHKVKLDFDNILLKSCTVGEALKNIDNKWFHRLTEKDKFLIKNTKPGNGLRETFNELMPKKKNKSGRVIGRPLFINFRLNKNTVSPTLIGGCHAVHPTCTRFITPLEQAALCGYPSNYKWSGLEGSWYKQIGQSVTPVMGDVLGKIFKKGLIENKLVKPTITLIDRRKSCR